MNKQTLLNFYKKLDLTPSKIIVFAFILLVVLFNFLLQNKVFISPIQFILDLYAHFLMAQSKLLLYFIRSEISFDFIKNQVLSQGHILTIDRFYFSLFQIVVALTIVLLTNSLIIYKAVSFIVVFMIISLYNSIRISLHAIYPETATVHNWFFNLVLIPRWLIVLGFAWYYWRKFPTLLDFLKKKFGFDDKFIQVTFLKIAALIAIYYIVVIFTFNDLIFLNGSLFISFILNISKNFIQFLGYDCWINNRLIYGRVASLYMDDSCMGVNLMFLFASFIALLPGALKHKLWYIPAGLIVIVLLNCLRIVFIFVNITKSGKYDMYMEIHDLFTYPVLVFTFVMWMIWINRFFKPKQTVQNKY